MAAVFAVFLIAILLAFVRPDGRAERITRFSAHAARAERVARACLAGGAGAIERAAAKLASNQRGRVRLDQLLRGRRARPWADAGNGRKAARPMGGASIT